MVTLARVVAPLTVPLFPSDDAVAVEVTAPMLMKPASIEIPLTVEVAVATAAVLVVDDDEVPEMLPMPISDEVEANGLPPPEGAWVGWVPLPPAVAASSPMVAVAVLPFSVEAASMLAPGSSRLDVFGVCG